jgi:YVTN family beta-propeller protein
MLTPRMPSFHFVPESRAVRQRRASLIALMSLSMSASVLAPRLEAAEATPPRAAASHAAAPRAKLAVLQRWTVGGDGGWDYLTFDPTTKQLLVSRGSHVDAISVDTGTVVGTVPNTQGVHGIALANDVRRGFTSNGRANSVTAFDLDTLKVIQEAEIPARNPDAILYDRQGAHVFTFNGASTDVTVLDATNLSVSARISLPDKPEFAVSDGSGRIFVNIESVPGNMVVIDSQGLNVAATWNLPGCDSPTGLAIDRANHRLFSVCDGKVMVVTDSQSGKQVASIPIGAAPDAAAYDARRRLVYSSNGEGTLTVIHQDSPDRYKVVQTLATKRGARTMALDPDTGKVYLVTADFGPAPAPTDAQPKPRPAPLAGSFVVLAVGTP